MEPTTRREALVSLSLLLLLLLHMCLGTTAITVKYALYEEQPAGTLVGRLSDDLQGRVAEHPSRHFRLMRRDDFSLVHVEEADGTVSAREVIDREQQCGQAPSCVIRFDVLCTLPRGLFQLVHAEVELLDINDHAPDFARSEMHVEISESVALGTRVPLEGARDLDVGGNALRAYHLDENERFGLALRARTDGAKYAELVVKSRLDREQEGEYTLQLTAWDGGDPPRSGTTLVRITVLDSNDNSPVFAQTSCNVTVREDATPGTVLLTLNATDVDEGPNGEVVYSFSSPVDAEVRRLFQLDPKTGKLSLKGQLDHELNSEYEISIQARDMGPSSIPAHCKVLVHVEDINDNAPEIKLDFIMQSRGDTVFVSEGAAYESFVGLVTVSDIDSAENGLVACHLRGHPHFKLLPYRDDYVVVTNSSLDREQMADYFLVLEASDGGTPPRVAARQFTVRLLDENDNEPRFHRSTYEASLLENNSPGAYVTTVTAWDADAEHNGMIAYNVVESEVAGASVSTYVSINPSSGAIYALRPLDYEAMTSLTFQVQARDDGVPPLVTNATVSVRIVDENDNAPVVTHPPLRNGTGVVRLPRDAGLGYLVTVVRARDSDSEANGELSYRIVQGNERNLFRINRLGGEVFTNAASVTDAAASAASATRHSLVVMVRDRGSPALSATAAIEIRVGAHGASENNDDNNDNDDNNNNDGGKLSGRDEAFGGSAPDGDDGADETQPLDASMLAVMALGAACALTLAAVVLVASTKSGSCGAAALEGKEEGGERRRGRSTPSTSSSEAPVEAPSRGSQRLARAEEGTGDGDASKATRTSVNKRDIVVLSSEAAGQLAEGDVEEPLAVVGTVFGPHGAASDSARGRRSEAQARPRDSLTPSQHSSEGFAEAEAATPSQDNVEVSQILTLLRQGKYRPRPSFRGNKYPRRMRCAEVDGQSLKDSGRGDSDTEECDSEPGRHSPLGSLTLSLPGPEHAEVPPWTTECNLPAMGHSSCLPHTGPAPPLVATQAVGTTRPTLLPLGLHSAAAVAVPRELGLPAIHQGPLTFSTFGKAIPATTRC
uniref:Protocadherin-18 n=1 Tax=Petromyzon marinus TaxID=7757 RepID=A0AAJ7WUY3_PETMA|nr:protocadherin-18 [Petromyzon marinus]